MRRLNGSPSPAAMVMLHGVVHAGQCPPALPPVMPHAPPIIVEAAGLAGIASPVPAPGANDGERALFDDPDRVAVLALGHNRLLSFIAENVDVAPLRLGSLHTSEHSVQEALAREATTFFAVLDRIAGAQEFAVRVNQDNPAACALHAPARNATLNGRDYLRARQGTLVQAREAASATAKSLQALREALAQIGEESLLLPARAGEAGLNRRLLDMAILVKRSATATFAEKIGTLSASLKVAGLTLDVTGPWPAYSFATAGR